MRVALIVSWGCASRHASPEVREPLRGRRGVRLVVVAVDETATRRQRNDQLPAVATLDLVDRVRRMGPPGVPAVLAHVLNGHRRAFP
jgi:hypothetical protein